MDPTTRKLWYLLQMPDQTRVSLKKALQLLEDCSWGTSITEQLHASASLFSRWHTEFGTESLVLRAGLRSMARLLPTETKLEREEKRLLAKMDALAKKNPNYLTGRQLFLKGLHDIAAAWESSTGRPLPHNLNQIVTMGHGKKWKEMSVQQRQDWERKAGFARGVSSDAIDSAVDAARFKLVEVRLKMTEATSQRPPLCLAACKFSLADEATLRNCLEAGKVVSRTQVKRARQQQLLIAPDVLPQLRLKELAEATVLKGERQKNLVRPPWLARVCEGREALRGATLIMEPAAGGPARHYKFLYAKKSPQSASFSPVWLSEAHPVPMQTITGANWEEIAMESWVRRFDIDVTQVVHWKDMPWLADDRLSVLPFCLIKDNQVLSDCEPIPLEEYLDGPIEPVPQGDDAGPDKTAAKRGRFEEAKVKKYPWLEVEEKDIVAGKVAGGKKVAKAGGAAGSSGDKYYAEGASLSDIEGGEIFKELQAMRDEWEWQMAEDDIPDFKGGVLGGTTAAQNIGKACDAFRGHASNADSAAWCSVVGLQVAARFDLTAYDGERGACIMVRAWMHRMQWMYQQYLEGDAASGWDGDILVGYDEPEEFTTFAAGLRGRTAARAEWIRKLRPRL